jgi:hypothetical protein
MPCDNPFVESLVNLRALIGQNVVSYSDARISQLHNPFARVARIYINRADNHVFDSRLKYCICARTSASFCGARFQRDVKRGLGGHGRGEVAKAFNLSVIMARFSMMSFCNDSIVNDEDRSNSGIGAGLAEPLPGLVERRAHELFVASGRHRFERSVIVPAYLGNANGPPTKARGEGVLIGAHENPRRLIRLSAPQNKRRAMALK